MFCNQCGASNSDKAIFCQKCGKRLEAMINDNPTLLAPPSIPASSYEGFPYTNYGPSDPIYPPRPPLETPESTSNPYGKQPSTRTHSNRKYLIVISILVIMLIGAGVFVGILLGKGNSQVNTGNTQATATSVAIPTLTITVTPTPIPTQVSPTPAQTLSTYTVTPLSDGRLEAWQSAPHAHWIQSRWIENGQWTSWVASTYPPSDAGVTGLASYTQQGITYVNVWLDDGSCWQYHKLSTSSNDGWTSFYRC